MFAFSVLSPQGASSLMERNKGRGDVGGGQGGDRTVFDSRGLGRGNTQEQDTGAAHWDSLAPRLLCRIFPRASLLPSAR